MRHGENPLEVTRRLRAQDPGAAGRACPRASASSRATTAPRSSRAPSAPSPARSLEAMLVATVCVVLVLRHLRTSFVIALTLPLAVLVVVRPDRRAPARWAWPTSQTNIMSLAGLAISIGVLVDSSIVMAENVMHQLQRRYGDSPARGDTPSRSPARLPDGRPADLLLGRHHAPVVPAGVRAGRAWRDDVPPAGVHQVVRPAGRGGAGDHRWCPPCARCSSAAGSAASRKAGSSAASPASTARCSTGSSTVRAGSSGWSGHVPRRVRAARLSLPSGGHARRSLSWPGCRIVQRTWNRVRVRRRADRRRAGRRAEHHAARPGVPDAARRGHGDGHADHRPAGVDHPGGRRPEGPRHDPLPVPRGGHGGRQGRPGRDADRPGPARHDRDDGRLPPARPVAEAEATRRRTPSARRPRPRRTGPPRADRPACRSPDIRSPRSTAAALARFDAPHARGGYQQNRVFEQGTRRTAHAATPSTGSRAIDRTWRSTPRTWRALDVHATHLAMTPTLEDVTALVDDLTARLIRRGAIELARRIASAGGRGSTRDRGAVREALGGSSAGATRWSSGRSEVGTRPALAAAIGRS